MITGVHGLIYTKEADAGVQLARPVSDEGWGLVSAIELPGGGELGLYEPRHPVAAA